MRLSKPEDDPNEAVEETSGEPTTVEIDGETVPIAEAVEQIAAESADAESVERVRDAVDELTVKVGQNEAALREVIEVVEFLGAWVQNEADHAQHAKEIMSAGGSDAYPFDWESPAYGVKNPDWE